MPGIPLHHGGQLAEQPLYVLPALHPVAEHLGQGHRALQVQHGVGRDPVREGISTSSTTMMACSRSPGGWRRRIPAKGTRGQGIEPQVNANVWLVPSGPGERDLALGLPRLSKMVS